MGKAKVSVSCVTKFKTSVTEEKNSATSLKSAVACVDAIVQKANEEIAKIAECEKNCKIALRTANEKIEMLQNELGELQSRLAVTPPTIMVSEPCGTDEEGDTIYEEVEEPNPEYYALLNQISEVEAKISKLKALINELQDKMQQLSKAKQTYQDAITHLNNGKKEIIVCCDNISKKSDMASSQLQKAIVAIQKYLGETIHTDPVPSYKSVSWSSYSSFDTIITSRDNIEMPTRTWDDDFGRGDTFYGISGKHFAESQNILISRQGEADSNYRGTCGLASTANVLRQLGLSNATEGDVLNRALQLDACAKPKDGKTGGGTRNDDIVKIMGSYGLQSSKVHDLTMKNITDCLDKGGAMMMSVQSKYIRDDAKIPTYMGFKKGTDHWVTVTGVRKNQYTGEVLGVYVQDTGGHNSNSNIFISSENFNKMRKISSDFTGIAVFK